MIGYLCIVLALRSQILSLRKTWKGNFEFSCTQSDSMSCVAPRILNAVSVAVCLFLGRHSLLPGLHFTLLWTTQSDHNRPNLCFWGRGSPLPFDPWKPSSLPLHLSTYKWTHARHHLCALNVSLPCYFWIMVKFLQRLTMARSISHLPCFHKPWVFSEQLAMSVSSRHHLSTSPPALHEEFFRNTSRRWM